MENFMDGDHGQGQGWPHLSRDKKRKQKFDIPEVWRNGVHL